MSAEFCKFLLKYFRKLAFAVNSLLLSRMSLLLFRHGFTARFARVSEIAEEQNFFCMLRTICWYTPSEQPPPRLAEVNKILANDESIKRSSKPTDPINQRSKNFLLSPAKEQRDVNKGRKLKTHALRAIAAWANFNPSRISNSLPLRRIVLYVCRPSCPPVFLGDQRQT
jgi:hypothetical protein